MWKVQEGQVKAHMLCGLAGTSETLHEETFSCVKNRFS